jgi:hypothetical protein
MTLDAEAIPHGKQGREVIVLLKVPIIYQKSQPATCALPATSRGHAFFRNPDLGIMTCKDCREELTGLPIETVVVRCVDSVGLR